ncbi:MAG: hypothetical protein ABUT20_52585 [Bacteroidota bacterium]
MIYMPRRGGIILLYATKDYIMIGADEKFSHIEKEIHEDEEWFEDDDQDDDDDDVEEYIEDENDLDKLTKIGFSSNIAYACVGACNFTGHNFNISEIIDSIEFYNEPFATKLNIITEALGPHLKKILSYSIVENFQPVSYVADGMLLNLVVVSFEKGKPICADIRYQMSIKSSKEAVIDSNVFYHGTSKYLYKSFGQNTALKLLEWKNRFFKRLYPQREELIRALIQIQSVFTPDDVEGPGKVILLTKDEIKFV